MFIIFNTETIGSYNVKKENNVKYCKNSKIMVKYC